MIVGIDVSKQSFDIAWVAEGQSHHQLFEYSDGGIEALLKQTPQKPHYVMEATSTSCHPGRLPHQRFLGYNKHMAGWMT